MSAMRGLIPFLVFTLTVTAQGLRRETDSVVLLSEFKLDYSARRTRVGAKSTVTINIQAKIARGSDSLSGRNLWRVGIFGSESPVGHGERTSYVEQILTANQRSKNVQRWKPLKFKNIRARFDFSQIGCGPVAYFCVEFARNEESSVTFELRAGTLTDAIVACKRLECQLSNVQSPLDEVAPDCRQPCPPPELIGGAVCSNNRVQYDSMCELTKAARCQGVNVGPVSPGECPPKKVIWSTLVWSSEFRTDVANVSSPLIDVNLFLININVGVNVTGDNLWQVSLYGSTDVYGKTGKRVANVEQALDHQLSSTALHGGHLFNLSFSVPFDIYAADCAHVPFICLELKRNPNATTDFILRCRDGAISCVANPCLFPPSGMVRVLFRELDWSFILETYRYQEPSDLRLNISVEVDGNSDPIRNGRNLWQVGIYGSSDPYGESGEKLNYIPQLLPGLYEEFPPDVVPGRRMGFPQIPFQFDISAIACGEYEYVCVTLTKHPDAEPDFEIATSKNKNRMVSCRLGACLPQTQDLVRLEIHSIDWAVLIENFRYQEPSDIGLNISMRVREYSQPIEGGRDLWQVEIYGSRDPDGKSGEKLNRTPLHLRSADEGYSLDVVPGGEMVLPVFWGQFDITAVGCTEYKYVCVIVSVNPAADPALMTLHNGHMMRILDCRRAECKGEPTARIQDIQWVMKIESFRDDDAVNVLIAAIIIPTADTDTIKGQNLWRIGIFLTNDISGDIAKFQHQRDILSETEKQYPLVRGRGTIFSDLEAVLDLRGAGCPGSSLQYACLEFARSDDPRPRFAFSPGEAGLLYSCQPLSCRNSG